MAAMDVIGTSGFGFLTASIDIGKVATTDNCRDSVVLVVVAALGVVVGIVVVVGGGEKFR